MNRKLVLRIAAIVSGVSGLIILLGIIYQIISYESTYGRRYSELISPLSEKDNKLTSTKILGIREGGKDYTRASNWFVGGANAEDFKNSKVQFFTISIPKLKIDGATVAIGGEDLNKSLIQYPGTALPGRPGNTVIFGHSVLPIFYNPKNYISIFSLLPTLRQGDRISIDYDGVFYRYEVEEMFEVSPTDIQVLDQDTSDSFITLVTCVPPGNPTNPRRLIVRARIIPPDSD